MSLLKQLVLVIFERAKKWSSNTKTRMLCNMKLDMKVVKNMTNHDNVKLSHKNVSVVEKNYISAKSTLQGSGGSLFYWLIVLVTMTTVYTHM